MTNFVFSRRAMQARINDLAKTLSPTQLTAIINRLNATDATRLHVMWELVILHGLSQAGHLNHEQALPNGRCPDIRWTIDKQDGGALTIIGDITTISDDGLDAQNPLKYISEEIFRIASKFGLRPGNFWIDVRGKITGPRNRSKMRLMLPEKSDMSSFIKTELEPWVYSIREAPTIKSRFDRTENNTNLKIIYDPNWENGGGSHTSYTVATSKNINPLFSALKGKVKQLNGAPDDSFRIVIVCDGGCDLIRIGNRGKSHYTYSAREVAEDFLRQNSSIDAVLLVAIDAPHPPFGSPPEYQMSYELICAPLLARSHRATNESIESLTAALHVALPNLPRPLRPAYHSASLLKTPGVGYDQLGRYSMQGNKITISSRGLLRLLAGEISTEEFIRAHGWDEPTNHANPFASNLKNGFMISNLDVTGDMNSDDDKITITVDKFDVAAAPFIFPSKDKGGNI
ncbi:hypothetical protein [Pseudomonas sp. Irchel 3E20]|uniref:hypothetical protein n=1 Tax=Pseudomonas sp. Irchel 3E20 TaxID=2008983 RepID=UPI002113B0F6|nr:hypothetical protein [Pseudomonas sp. Irchel 3E20]